MMKRFRIYAKRSLILQWSVLTDGAGQVLFLRRRLRGSKLDFKAYLLLPNEQASLSDV